MQRLRRIVSTCLYTLAGCIGLSFLAVWPLSYWWNITVKHHSGTDVATKWRDDEFWLGPGTASWREHQLSPAGPRAPGKNYPRYPLPPDWSHSINMRQPDAKYPWLGLFTFRFASHDEPLGKVDVMHVRIIEFPLWLVPTILLAVVLPLLRRPKAIDRSICAACGYDLRASPVRCPECGMKVGQQSAGGAAAPS